MEFNGLAAFLDSGNQKEWSDSNGGIARLDSDSQQYGWTLCAPWATGKLGDLHQHSNSGESPLVSMAPGRLDIKGHGLLVLATCRDKPFGVSSRQRRRGGVRRRWLQVCLVSKIWNIPSARALGGVGSVGGVSRRSNLGGPVSFAGVRLYTLVKSLGNSRLR